MTMYVHEYWLLDGVVWNYHKVMTQLNWAEYSAGLTKEFQQLMINYDLTMMGGY